MLTHNSAGLDRMTATEQRFVDLTLLNSTEQPTSRNGANVPWYPWPWPGPRPPLYMPLYRYIGSRRVQASHAHDEHPQWRELTQPQCRPAGVHDHAHRGRPSGRLCVSGQKYFTGLLQYWAKRVTHWWWATRAALLLISKSNEDYSTHDACWN